jgi:hypothetical protein
MIKPHVLTFLLAALLAGCAPKITRAELDQQKQADVARKATFELDCAREQLSFQCLADGRVPHAGWCCFDACTSWGVSGCGKKAVYVLTDENGWINNTGAEKK